MFFNLFHRYVLSSMMRKTLDAIPNILAERNIRKSTKGIAPAPLSVQVALL
jgi:hypothetical protein